MREAFEKMKQLCPEGEPISVKYELATYFPVPRCNVYSQDKSHFYGETWEEAIARYEGTFPTEQAAPDEEEE